MKCYNCPLDWLIEEISVLNTKLTLNIEEKEFFCKKIAIRTTRTLELSALGDIAKVERVRIFSFR